MYYENSMTEGIEWGNPKRFDDDWDGKSAFDEEGNDDDN